MPSLSVEILELDTKIELLEALIPYADSFTWKYNFSSSKVQT